MPAARTVACPQCGKRVEWTRESPYRPFCSERCKMLDFGAWAAEAYRLPVDPHDEDAESTPRDDNPPSK
jgi:endogenous inhibitor of DNA gyrase (YacG/DUF329 family)